MKRFVPCHWTNREPIGSPPKFVVTGWRMADDEKPPRQAKPEKKAGRRGVVATAQGSLL